ncbi:MAG TPA: DUF1475 family protein [Dongiaceae bacterium]|nr:DUF1475 family protein [Dongiaceae bacterium]
MNALKILLVVLWVLLTGITIYAIQTLGSEAGMVFLSDFLHPWRAQFNTDFVIHLLLFVVWVVWREESKAVGIVSAALCLLGGLFTLLYLLFAVYRADGEPKKLLLGVHAKA